MDFQKLYQIYQKLVAPRRLHGPFTNYGVSDLEVQLLINHRLVTVNSAGGLLKGPSHQKGGVLVIQKFKPDYYSVIAVFEGEEYILNPEVTQTHLQVLNKINSYDKGYKPYSVLKDTLIIDCCPQEIDGHLLTPILWYQPLKSSFIVNKHATKSIFINLIT